METVCHSLESMLNQIIVYVRQRYGTDDQARNTSPTATCCMPSLVDIFEALTAAQLFTVTGHLRSTY
jgi:hypothetical protein